MKCKCDCVQSSQASFDQFEVSFIADSLKKVEETASDVEAQRRQSELLNQVAFSRDIKILMLLLQLYYSTIFMIRKVYFDIPLCCT